MYTGHKVDKRVDKPAKGSGSNKHSSGIFSGGDGSAGHYHNGETGYTQHPRPPSPHDELVKAEQGPPWRPQPVPDDGPGGRRESSESGDPLSFKPYLTLANRIEGRLTEGHDEADGA